MYALPEVRIVAAQLLRGALAALILYPIYAYVTRHERAELVLFGFFWGLTMLGSVEPLPGSIEGWLYTETPLRAHALIALASAVHAAILAWSIPLVERLASSRGQAVSREGVRVFAAGALRMGRGTMLRFVRLHVGTYVLAGVVFMMVQDYATAFATQEQFAHFRPPDDPMLALAIPMQIPRGLLLGVCLSPFVGVAIGRRRGWLLLFSVVFGATALATAGSASTLFGVVTSDVAVEALVVDGACAAAGGEAGAGLREGEVDGRGHDERVSTLVTRMASSGARALRLGSARRYTVLRSRHEAHQPA